MRRTINSDAAAKDRQKKVYIKQHKCAERPLFEKENAWERGPTAMEETKNLNS